MSKLREYGVEDFLTSFFSRLTLCMLVPAWVVAPAACKSRDVAVSGPNAETRMDEDPVPWLGDCDSTSTVRPVATGACLEARVIHIGRCVGDIVNVQLLLGNTYHPRQITLVGAPVGAIEDGMRVQVRPGEPLLTSCRRVRVEGETEPYPHPYSWDGHLDVFSPGGGFTPLQTLGTVRAMAEGPDASNSEPCPPPALGDPDPDPDPE